ncbi:MAG: lysophospholipid acyltransferase family protein [Anaerolineaceae bacterium]|nr:lysophospholipid acyltransferase family protein [Anaerolineaceae bacterium]
MKIHHWFFLNLMRAVFNSTCRIDSAQLARLPKKGPSILVINHVNFLEVPVLYTLLQDRQLQAWVKFETWQSFTLRSLFEPSIMVPVRRGEADRTALRLAQQSLEVGNILAVSPEGTRDNGHLKIGHPGVSLVALRAQVPVWPLVFFGGESYWQNLPRFKKTDFRIIVGNPFYLDAHGEHLSREVVQEMTDEIMYQLAALLPSSYRGLYSDFNKARQTYLRFDPGVSSNLDTSFRSTGKSTKLDFPGNLSPQL